MLPVKENMGDHIGEGGNENREWNLDTVTIPEPL